MSRFIPNRSQNIDIDLLDPTFDINHVSGLSRDSLADSSFGSWATVGASHSEVPGFSQTATGNLTDFVGPNMSNHRETVDRHLQETLLEGRIVTPRVHRTGHLLGGFSPDPSVDSSFIRSSTIRSVDATIATIRRNESMTERSASNPIVGDVFRRGQVIVEKELTSHNLDDSYTGVGGGAAPLVPSSPVSTGRRRRILEFSSPPMSPMRPDILRSPVSPSLSHGKGSVYYNSNQENIRAGTHLPLTFTPLRESSHLSDSSVPLSTNLVTMASIPSARSASSGYLGRNWMSPSAENPVRLFEPPVVSSGVRAIPNVPYHVLEAPGIEDDYYLHLIDWSLDSVIAVALGTDVYMWHSPSTSVMRLPRAAGAASVTSVRWSSCSSTSHLLSVGTDNGVVEIWDASELKLMHALGGHNRRVACMDWSYSRLATGSRDRRIHIHDLREKGCNLPLDNDGSYDADDYQASIASTHFRPADVLRAHKQEVCGLRWNPEHDRLASGGNDNKVFVWSLSHAGNPFGEIQGTNMTETPNLGSSPFSASLSSTFMKTDNFGASDKFDGENIKIPQSNNHFDMDIDESTPNSLKTTDRTSGHHFLNTLASLQPSFDSTSTPSFAPRANTKREPILDISEHQAAVKALAWSPHERGLLASGGGTSDSCIRVVNTNTGVMEKCVRTSSQVCQLEWSRSRKELVSTHGYSTNAVCIWDYASMRRIVTLLGHNTRVLYLSISPDGRDIVTGSADETLRLWRVFPAVESVAPKSLPDISSPLTPRKLKRQGSVFAIR